MDSWFYPDGTDGLDKTFEKTRFNKTSRKGGSIVSVITKQRGRKAGY